MEVNNMEIWKKIKDFDYYEVSNLGRVRSIRFDKERILKPEINSDGYPIVALYKEGKVLAKLVHRLVAEVFKDGK